MCCCLDKPVTINVKYENVDMVLSSRPSFTVHEAQPNVAYNVVSLSHPPLPAVNERIQSNVAYNVVSPPPLSTVNEIQPNSAYGVLLHHTNTPTRRH